MLVRHGESQWNKENRFTGWVDVPLAETGVAEAERAGKALKEEGFECAPALKPGGQLEERQRFAART